MSTARKAALLDRAREKREAKKYDLSSVPSVGTMSIANFFKPRTGGPAAAPAEEARDAAAVDETSRDSVSGTLDTPMKDSPQEVTPDTQKVGRKRLRQVDSSDDEDGGADERTEAPAENEPERAAAKCPAKCPAKAPAASPVKAASSKLAASFFLKKKTEAESEGKGAQPPAEEATASEATAAPAGDKSALAKQPAAESSGRGSAKPPAKAAKAESKAEAKAEGKGSAKDAANEDEEDDVTALPVGEADGVYVAEGGKRRMSALDLQVQARALRATTVGMRVSNIYDLGPKSILLKMAAAAAWRPDGGGGGGDDGGGADGAAGPVVASAALQGDDGARRTLLVVESGVRIHTSRFERDKGLRPSNFAAKLRKHLRGQRLQDARALGADRVMQLTFGRGNRRAPHPAPPSAPCSAAVRPCGLHRPAPCARPPCGVRGEGRGVSD